MPTLPFYKTHSNTTLYSSVFIFPIVLLCVFQFIAITLSITPIPFSLNILLSLSSALYIASKITTAFSSNIEYTYAQLSLMFLIASTMTVLFILRLSNGIPDLTCTTGILGLAHQILDGHFPVSYQSLPEIRMNYHQGYVFITSVVSLIFNLSPVTAFKILYPALFFFINIAAMSLLIKLRNPFYFLPPFLFLFIASAGSAINTFFQVPLLGQISVFEFLTNNSWPMALVLIISLLFILLEFKTTKQNIVLVAILILSLSTLNAIAFQVVISSLAVYYILSISHQKSTTKTNFIFICATAALVVLLPRFIPSAFSFGSLYSSPHIVFRPLSPDSATYLGDVINLLLLLNPLPVFVLGIALISFRRYSPSERLLAIALAFSISFPLLFRFSNIIDWDMLHKFSYISMFFAAILLPLQMQQYRDKLLYFIIVLIICIATSIQTVYEMTQERMNTNYLSSNKPAEDALDVIAYLSKNKTTLIPYTVHDTVLPWHKKKVVFCDTYADYSAIGHFSGNFIRDTYDTNFLLNENFENLYFKNSSWADFGKKATEVAAQIESGETLIVDKKRLDTSSQERLEAVINANKIEFERYVLYQK